LRKSTVSLLSNKSLHLHIGALSVQGSLRPGWGPGKVLARASLDFNPQINGRAMPGATLEPGDSSALAIETVLSELVASTPSQKPDLVVVLADSRVHFDVVSGDYGTASEKHLQAIANACVAEILGDTATSQIVRWQLQPDMKHLLISAMGSQDIELVVQAGDRHQLPLKSLQPDFCAKWNQYAKALPDGTGVFATVCDGHLIVAFALRGSIAALSSGSTVNDERSLPYDIRSKDAIDERVDRLLSSVGRDSNEISSFVMVAPNRAQAPKSLRWTIINPSQESS
jgi:hypothetical protein